MKIRNHNISAEYQYMYHHKVKYYHDQIIWKTKRNFKNIRKIFTENNKSLNFSSSNGGTVLLNVL